MFNVTALLQPPAFNLTDAEQTCREAILNSQVYAACGTVAGLMLDIDAKVEACVMDLQVMLRPSPLWHLYLYCGPCRAGTLSSVPCSATGRTLGRNIFLCHVLVSFDVCSTDDGLYSITCRCRATSCGHSQRWTACSSPASTSC